MRCLLSSTVAIAVALVSGFLRQAYAMPPTALVEGRPDRTVREGAPRDDPFASTIAVSSVSGSTIGSCLGVMVAPRIALTAGHCVSTSAKITVHAATVGGSTKVVAVDRFWFDPTTDSSDRGPRRFRRRPRRTVFARVDLVADKLDELVFSTASIREAPRKSPAVPKAAPPRLPPPPSKPISPPPPLNVRWT